MNKLKTIWNKINWLQFLYWSTYLGLLGVMLPHTVWTAEQIYEDYATALAFGIVFELGILGFSISFKKQIELSRRLRQRANESNLQLWIRKQGYQFFNVFFFGLLISALLSGLANFSYAVEFGSTELKALDIYSLPLIIYHVGFGLILPIIAILFSFVLAQRPLIEEDTALQNELKKLRRENGIAETSNKELIEVNSFLHNSLEKFSKLAEKEIAAEEKLAILFELFPTISNSGAASIIDVTPAYVTQCKIKWAKAEEDW